MDFPHPPGAIPQPMAPSPTAPSPHSPEGKQGPGVPCALDHTRPNVRFDRRKPVRCTSSTSFSSPLLVFTSGIVKSQGGLRAPGQNAVPLGEAASLGSRVSRQAGVSVHVHRLANEEVDLPVLRKSRYV